MSRKYLEDIAPKIKPQGYHDNSDYRHQRWLEQEKIYGFNDKETWDLDKTFAELIYERLTMYKKIGGEVVNLTCHEFDIDGVTLTLEECIEIILTNCEMAIRSDNPDTYTEHMDKVWGFMKEIHWCLWW